MSPSHGTRFRQVVHNLDVLAHFPLSMGKTHTVRIGCACHQCRNRYHIRDHLPVSAYRSSMGFYHTERKLYTSPHTVSVCHRVQRGYRRVALRHTDATDMATQDLHAGQNWHILPLWIGTCRRCSFASSLDETDQWCWSDKCHDGPDAGAGLVRC